MQISIQFFQNCPKIVFTQTLNKSAKNSHFITIQFELVWEKKEEKFTEFEIRE